MICARPRSLRASQVSLKNQALPAFFPRRIMRSAKRFRTGPEMNPKAYSRVKTGG